MSGSRRKPPGPSRHPHLQRLYHFAAKIRDDGAVSPLCAKTPRAIDLTQALWTIRREAVTCPKCLAVMATEVAG